MIEINFNKKSQSDKVGHLGQVLLGFQIKKPNCIPAVFFVVSPYIPMISNPSGISLAGYQLPLFWSNLASSLSFSSRNCMPFTFT